MQVAMDSADLITRSRKSRKHDVKMTFHENFASTYQKGLRVSTNLKKRNAIKPPRHKTKQGLWQNIIFPFVIAVKRDDSVKLAFDSIILSKSTHKSIRCQILII